MPPPRGRCNILLRQWALIPTCTPFKFLLHMHFFSEILCFFLAGNDIRCHLQDDGSTSWIVMRNSVILNKIRPHSSFRERERAGSRNNNKQRRHIFSKKWSFVILARIKNMASRKYKLHKIAICKQNNHFDRIRSRNNVTLVRLTWILHIKKGGCKRKNSQHMVQEHCPFEGIYVLLAWKNIVFLQKECCIL